MERCQNTYRNFTVQTLKRVPAIRHIFSHDSSLKASHDKKLSRRIPDETNNERPVYLV